MSASVPPSADSNWNENDPDEAYEDDSDDIEWEGCVIKSPKETPGNHDPSAVDWEQVNAHLNSTLEPNKKRKKSKSRLTKYDRLRNARLHQMHLILLLCMSKHLHSLQYSNVARGLLYSIAIKSFDGSQSGTECTKFGVRKMMRWIRETFTVKEISDNAKCSMISYHHWKEENLIEAITSRSCSQSQLILLFAMLCQSFGYYCRIITTLDAYDVRSKGFEQLTAKCTMSSQKKNKKDAETPHLRFQFIWIEFYDTVTNAYVPCNIYEVTMHDSHDFEKLRRRVAPMSYIIAFDQCSGLCIDVTARYVEDWGKTMQCRIAHEWFDATLNQYNQFIIQRSENCPKYRNVLAKLHDEKNKLLQSTESLEIPRTVEGFKRHSIYCLESHLGQNEALHPRKPAGTFKGQLFFLREHIRQLQSKRKWLREGKIVKEAEIPAKCVRRKRNLKSDEFELALFGDWQTEPYVPAEILDGKVPKNEHGNIEVFSEQHIPKGAVHITLPQIKLVADFLEIDYAPALTGFETRNGYNCPKIEGIVVAQAHLDILMDAYTQKKQQLIEKAIKVNQNLIVKRWGKVVRRLLLRARLEEDYGNIKE